MKHMSRYDWYMITDGGQYYHVGMALNGPVVYCDDWQWPIDEIWVSYVVFPYGQTWED